MNNGSEPQVYRRSLYRSRSNRMIMGVCGGIADYFDVSPTVVRILTVLLVFFTSGIWILVYFIMGLGMKPEPVFEPGQGGAAAYPPGSRAALLAGLQERFDHLEKRLQRLESIVTRSDYDLDDEFRKL